MTDPHLKNSPILEALGGEEGCERLSAEFYARVGVDPDLRPLFPGKSLRCATEEFASFLVQFLQGDEEHTQKRGWLSLRESHARFSIVPSERDAWLTHMAEALDAIPLAEATRTDLKRFFDHASEYVASGESDWPERGELGARWNEQRLLDDAIAAIDEGRFEDAIGLAARFAPRPSVSVGLLVRMIQSGHVGMCEFVIDTVERRTSLIDHRFAGRSLLHFAAAAGCSRLVEALLRLGASPRVVRGNGHTPLYDVANECASESGPEVVGMLVEAGADVNACGGVMRATPLHMAARRGFTETARALLDAGATIDPRDRNGVTPLQRAINCRKEAVAQLLLDRGASRST